MKYSESIERFLSFLREAQEAYDIIINETFPDAKEPETVATFFYCSAGHKQPQQQCILLCKEVYNP